MDRCRRWRKLGWQRALTGEFERRTCISRGDELILTQYESVWTTRNTKSGQEVGGVNRPIAPWERKRASFNPHVAYKTYRVFL